MKITRKRNVINKAGIFAGSLLVAATAVYLYSPVFSSHAGNSAVGALVNAMIALTAPENLRLEITPSAAGATASDSIDISVNTNSLYGYELYFSATDTDTDMTTTSSNAVIESDFTTTSLANIPVNSWGYSLDNTDYSPIPTSENSTRIRNIEHTPAANEKVTSLYFGVKADTSLASGFYSDDVLFSVVANASLVPIIPTMQDFDVTLIPNVGDSTRLQDARDGTMYNVVRLADGNVWMTKNLKITGKTITSEDSNLPDGETFIIPENDISTLTATLDTAGAYAEDEYGGFYNFYTVTAGWGTSSVTSGNSPKDICPKGWRLPTGGDNSEFQTLFDEYTGNYSGLMEQAKFIKAGQVYGGGRSYKTSFGLYWTSTAYDGNNAYYYDLAWKDQHRSKKYGYSVRCIAK
jgi:uncharacterized protein (TIGR02145 family)